MSRCFDPIGLFYFSVKRHVEDLSSCRRRLMILRDAKRRRLIRKLEKAKV